MTPLNRLSINFDWYAWMPLDVLRRYMGVNKAKKIYWWSFMGHLKRCPFLKSTYFQEWGQDLGAWRPCIGSQSAMIGMNGCLWICPVDIWVLTKQKIYGLSFRGHVKMYAFSKSAYCQEWGQDLGVVTPLHRLSINFNWYECMPLDVPHWYMGVNKAKIFSGGPLRVIEKGIPS